MTATEVFRDQLRDGGGHLVNISSVAGRTARAGNAAYAATAITANDIAQIIAFAVSRPHSVSLSEILVRPTAQQDAWLLTWPMWAFGTARTVVMLLAAAARRARAQEPRCSSRGMKLPL